MRLRRTTLLAGGIGLLVLLGLPPAPARAQDVTTLLARFLSRFRMLIQPVNGGLVTSQTFTDGLTLNTWNTMSVTIPAAALQTNLDYLVIEVDAKTSANGDNHVFQLYWNGATCSGTGAGCCATGTQIYSIASTGSGVSMGSRDTVTRTASNAQNIQGYSMISTSITSGDATTATVTDTAAIPVVWCTRNATNSAAVVQGTPSLRVLYVGQ